MSTLKSLLDRHFLLICTLNFLLAMCGLILVTVALAEKGGQERQAEQVRARDQVVAHLESTYGVAVVAPEQLLVRGDRSNVPDVQLRRDGTAMLCTVYVDSKNLESIAAFCDGSRKELDRRAG